jgi:hypothetical protein
MTVTHLNPPRPPDEPPSDDEAYPREVRTPPQDIAAEQCVLGSAMLAKDAVPDLRDAGLQPTEFYVPDATRRCGGRSSPCTTGGSPSTRSRSPRS